MPFYYYKQEFLIDKDGSKMGVLFVDSCLILCSNRPEGKMTEEEIKNYITWCDPWYRA